MQFVRYYLKTFIFPHICIISTVWPCRIKYTGNQHILYTNRICNERGPNTVQYGILYLLFVSFKFHMLFTRLLYLPNNNCTKPLRLPVISNSSIRLNIDANIDKLPLSLLLRLSVIWWIMLHSIDASSNNKWLSISWITGCLDPKLHVTNTRMHKIYIYIL